MMLRILPLLRSRDLRRRLRSDKSRLNVSHLSVREILSTKKSKVSSLVFSNNLPTTCTNLSWFP